MSGGRGLALIALALTRLSCGAPPFVPPPPSPEPVRAFTAIPVVVPASTSWKAAPKTLVMLSPIGLTDPVAIVVNEVVAAVQVGA